MTGESHDEHEIETVHGAAFSTKEKAIAAVLRQLPSTMLRGQWESADRFGALTDVLRIRTQGAWSPDRAHFWFVFSTKVDALDA